MKRGWVLTGVFFLLVAYVAYAFYSTRNASWRTANRQSANISPKPSAFSDAIVQVFYARTFGWRGKFAVHSWIAYKEKNASDYVVTEVLGWRKFRQMPVVSVEIGEPDRIWFDNVPVVLQELRGPKAERAIEDIKNAIQTYSYPNEYILWPGPNSNSYIAHLIRSTRDLTVELPANAIGKDRLMGKRLWDWSQTGKGIQFSLAGLFGVTLGLHEGVEINVLTLCFGVDLLRPAIKLPFVGRLGIKDK
ncbi:MAG: DUF3750 domain-containing protein [Bdellovibrionota bacterium]